MITGVKQEIIFMAIAVKICYPHDIPAERKCWAKSAANKNVIVQKPDRCLARGRIGKHVVRKTVAVEVACFYQFPSVGKRRPESGPDERWSGQIPNSRLIR